MEMLSTMTKCFAGAGLMSGLYIGSTVLTNWSFFWKCALVTTLIGPTCFTWSLWRTQRRQSMDWGGMMEAVFPNQSLWIVNTLLYSGGSLVGLLFTWKLLPYLAIAKSAML